MGRNFVKKYRKEFLLMCFIKIMWIIHIYKMPGKVLMKLEGKPVLWHVASRVSRSSYVDDVVVATTFKKEDLEIVKYCSSNGIRIFTGSEDDVLDRYYQAAKLFKPDNVIRKDDNDYTSNTIEETFPDGLDCEIMKFSVLEDTWKKAVMASEREHVTQYIIKNNKYKLGCVLSPVNRKNERWTLDTAEDYNFIKKIFSRFYSVNPEFGSEDIYAFLDSEPELRKINSNILRNEGLLKSLMNDHVFALEES